jgi:hypothetical protein
VHGHVEPFGLVGDVLLPWVRAGVEAVVDGGAAEATEMLA